MNNKSFESSYQKALAATGPRGYWLYQNGRMIGHFKSLTKAKAAGLEPYGHKERWTKTSFALVSGGPFHTEWTGGSGNSFVIQDYEGSRKEVYEADKAAKASQI